MDAAAELQQDLRDGQIDVDRFVDRLNAAHRELGSRLDEQSQEIVGLKKRIAELEQEIAKLHAKLGTSPTVRIDQPFSIKAEEKRQEARGRKKRKESKKRRRGRIASEEKLKRAQEIKDVYPEGIDPDLCKFSHVRVVWRLQQGVATLIGYRIFRGPKKQYGIIPGVLGRSEFGLEIVVTLAYLIYVTGLSFDKACMVMNFLQNVQMSKSQADSLLHQLSRHWETEFEVLCTLLANSLVVHTDETSWSINSVWAFLSVKARLLFFGVHKDAGTLKEILDPELFAGLVFSDDAAVYASFTNSQKCWAHLLRKAIKLTLQDPQNVDYRAFTDRLLEIYREATRILHDKRLSDAGRMRKVEALIDETLDLSCPVLLEDPAAKGLAHDRRLLAMEIIRLALKKELFEFVLAKPAEQPNGASLPLNGTNNEAERTLRDPALARKTGRTSKTPRGARRTSILKSVLESLRLYVAKYTLPQVIEEIQRWQQTGKSCFRALLEKLHLIQPKHSVLDHIYAAPDG